MEAVKSMLFCSLLINNVAWKVKGNQIHLIKLIATVIKVMHELSLIKAETANKLLVNQKKSFHYCFNDPYWSVIGNAIFFFGTEKR